jgi:hypothetical protein
MSERTQKLETIFHTASELNTPEQRERYLAEACLADAELRHQVESLLIAVPVGDALFRACEQHSQRSGSASIPSEVVTEHAGSVIGRYKVLEKIGEGGMGVVYMAEQEQPVRRKVALKIIKLGMDTRQVIARFEAERQALAIMDHPHIAQVLDAGATETGRPYFVMELVQGVPITQFCDANQLAFQERLKLFIPLCHAIQSAHQKGIIHRDIKPSNVLVTMHNGAPHPIVIDFGVAKAMDQELTERTLFTNFATMIGTPAYMSPEQAEMGKLHVDTRSDIYSLGVLLYELLAGSPPFPEERLRSVAYREMQRIIVEEEPERPSTRLKKKTATGSATQLSTPESSLATDLDWIVMKCLDKDRTRRYDTANNLAADIQRHLNNEAVLARPPSVGYRFQKLAQRHKAAFAAVAVVAAVLVSAAVLSTWQAIRATRAERSARAVKEFLIAHVLAANPYIESEPDPNRQALIERMARAIDTKFTNQPVIEADLRMVLAGAFDAFNDWTNAEIQCRKAFEIRRRELGPRHSDTRWSLAWMVQVQVDDTDKTAARKLLEDAVADIRKSHRPLSSGDAEIIWTYGQVLNRDHGVAEALPYLNEAVAVCRRMEDSRDYRFKIKLRDLARATEDAGDLDGAERMWKQNLEDAEREFSADHILVATTSSWPDSRRAAADFCYGVADQRRHYLWRNLPRAFTSGFWEQITTGRSIRRRCWQRFMTGLGAWKTPPGSMRRFIRVGQRSFPITTRATGVAASQTSFCANVSMRRPTKSWRCFSSHSRRTLRRDRKTTNRSCERTCYWHKLWNRKAVSMMRRQCTVACNRTGRKFSRTGEVKP